MLLQDIFRRRVQEELDERGWTQSELGRNLDPPANPSFVNQYVMGRRCPGLDVVERFAKALGYDDPRMLLEEKPAKRKLQPVA